MKHTIYIRDEDETKWQAIADKPGWLHIAINRGFLYPEAIPELLKGAGFNNANTAKEVVEYSNKIAGDHSKGITLDEPTTEPFEPSA